MFLGFSCWPPLYRYSLERSSKSVRYRLFADIARYLEDQQTTTTSRSAAICEGTAEAASQGRELGLTKKTKKLQRHSPPSGPLVLWPASFEAIRLGVVAPARHPRRADVPSERTRRAAI